MNIFTYMPSLDIKNDINVKGDFLGGGGETRDRSKDERRY
jgi:hypothetical protein